MRALLAILPLLAAGVAPITDEKLNFSLSAPASDAWTPAEVDPAGEVKVHLRTEFADSDPTAYGEVRLLVRPLAKSQVKLGNDKIAAQWKDALEGHLENPRERTEKEFTVGGKPGWKVDLKGDWGPGTHHRSYILCKNGSNLYLFVIDRTYKAIGDEDVEKEISEILDSFKFLREEKIEASKQGGSEEAPEGIGGGKKPEEAKIDPKLLEREEIDGGDFWRFRCVKPAGFLSDALSDADKTAGVKYRFSARKDSSALTIYVYIDSLESRKYTIDQLSESAIKNFKATRKDPKEPVVDKKFKVKLAKDAFKVEMVGRRASVEKETWIFAECENERQYRIQMLSIGGADKKLQKEIEEFLKSFEPYKKK